MVRGHVFRLAFWQKKSEKRGARKMENEAVRKAVRENFRNIALIGPGFGVWPGKTIQRAPIPVPASRCLRLDDHARPTEFCRVRKPEQDVHVTFLSVRLASRRSADALGHSCSNPVQPCTRSVVMCDQGGLLEEVRKEGANRWTGDDRVDRRGDAATALELLSCSPQTCTVPASGFCSRFQAVKNPLCSMLHRG